MESDIVLQISSIVEDESIAIFILDFLALHKVGYSTNSEMRKMPYFQGNQVNINKFFDFVDSITTDCECIVRVDQRQTRDLHRHSQTIQSRSYRKNCLDGITLTLMAGIKYPDIDKDSAILYLSNRGAELLQSKKPYIIPEVLSLLLILVVYLIFIIMNSYKII